MSKETVTVKRLLSKQTVEKLDGALSKGKIEQLKKHMEKLFTFKNIFNMHDDHLIELAECIVDLAEADNRLESARAMEQYAQKRISRYHERKNRLLKENQWTKVAKNIDEVNALDLEYRLWVYESGFEYSKYQMYIMLCNITREIQECEKEGKK